MRTPPKGFRRAHEPTAALGPAETAQVGELIKQLKSEGLGIFLISHDIHEVFDLADRVTVSEERPGRRRLPRRGPDQGRGARHDYPWQMPAWRDSRAKGHGAGQLRGYRVHWLVFDPKLKVVATHSMSRIDGFC
jgi:hypothetical protein